MSIFKPVRWNTLLRDFLVIEVGLAMFGLAIAIMIRANLGTSAWAVLEVALARLIGLTPGRMSIMMGLFILSGALILREKIGWGTLANIISVGLWEDLALGAIAPVNNNLPLQATMLLGAIGMMGLASAIYIGVDAGAGPRDTLMLAIKRKTGWSVGIARAAIEVTVVTIGWLFGGPAGVGTVIFALLIGMAVQLGFKLFNVDPHRPIVPSLALKD
jgi:uncharacterized membrane protein YczE